MTDKNTNTEASAGREASECSALLSAISHEANEWADAACNGLQWLRNIKDGVSTPEEAIASMTDNIAHCREIRSSR